MNNETNDRSPLVNHVFVDYENVHTIDPAIIGTKTVHLTLLLGPKSTKFDATVVEKLVKCAANVEFVRLKSSGKNAVDFALAYYLGRAVLADPCGYFHIVSKDKGYDALIEHLRSKHIHVRRHEDFATLTFATQPKPSAATMPVANPVAKPPMPPASTASPASKPPSKPKPSTAGLEELEVRVLKYLRKPTTNRPRTQEKLASALVTHLGKKVNKPEALILINMLSQAGRLVIGDQGRVTYNLDQA